MGHYPRTDISLDTQGLLIEMAVPGLSTTDITLELVNNSLCISGRCKERSQHSNYTSKELYTGHFSRGYPINSKKFDLTQITSKVINGFLTIKIPYKDVVHTDQIRTLDIVEGQDGNQ